MLTQSHFDPSPHMLTKLTVRQADPIMTATDHHICWQNQSCRSRDSPGWCLRCWPRSCGQWLWRCATHSSGCCCSRWDNPETAGPERRLPPQGCHHSLKLREKDSQAVVQYYLTSWNWGGGQPSCCAVLAYILKLREKDTQAVVQYYITSWNWEEGQPSCCTVLLYTGTLRAGDHETWQTGEIVA